MPPGGFVAGIDTRNDINRTAYKAQASEIVNLLAPGFKSILNMGGQKPLDPKASTAPATSRGLLWRARTISSDPEWKYVNTRRNVACLVRSIDNGTHWAVFKPNGEWLWTKISA